MAQKLSKLDHYCLFIVSKYFNNINDYANLEKTCKTYGFITDEYKYNPIPISENNEKLFKIFKNIETYHFYIDSNENMKDPENKIKRDTVYKLFNHPNVNNLNNLNTTEILNNICQSICQNTYNDIIKEQNQQDKIEQLKHESQMQRMKQMNYIKEISRMKQSQKELQKNLEQIQSKLCELRIKNSTSENSEIVVDSNIQIKELENQLNKTEHELFKLKPLIYNQVNCVGAIDCRVTNLYEIFIAKNISKDNYIELIFDKSLMLTELYYRKVFVKDNYAEMIPVLSFNQFTYRCKILINYIDGPLVKILYHINSDRLLIYQIYSVNNNRAYLTHTINIPIKHKYITILNNLRNNYNINNVIDWRITNYENTYPMIKYKNIKINTNVFGDIEKITIPNNINYFGSHCFTGSNLTKIDLGSVEKIDRYAFSECTKLNLVDLSNVKIICDDAFMGCDQLEEIDLTNLINIGICSFANCGRLNKVKLGTKLKELKYSTFYECQSLVNIDLSNINIIDGECFRLCYNLTNITLSSNLEVINNACFAKCLSLQEINIKNVKCLKDYSFARCSELTKIIISTNLTRIDQGCFKNCHKLKCIMIDDFKLYENSYLNENSKKNAKMIIQKYIDESKNKEGEDKEDDDNNIDDDDDEDKLSETAEEDDEYDEDDEDIDNEDDDGDGDINYLYRTSQLQNANLKNEENIIDLRNIEYIGKECFKDCVQLENILLSSELTKLRIRTFCNCLNLKNINLENITCVCRHCFDNCNKLTKTDE